MATQRRMVYAKILENKDFGFLSPNAKVLYIFCIVLADDEGRLKANAVALRGRVFAFDEIVKSRLVTWYKVENEYFISHPNWVKYQILRTDRTKKSDIPPPDGNQMATKWVRKISKLSKEERKALAYLKNIPESDLKEFYERFDCSKKAIISKAEDLLLWCESNAKLKKNYKAFLLTALKKDFPVREVKKPITATENISLSVVKSVSEILADTKKFTPSFLKRKHESH